MNQASFLMSGIPMSDGILPMVKQELGEVDGAPALLTDLKESDRTHHAKLRLYTAVQTLEHDFFPRVRFSMREVSWWDMTVVDGRLALVGEEFAVEMKGWALVKVVDDRCSPQTIVTRCTLYQQNCISHGIYFVPLSLARKYSRSEKPKIIWFFAHLFVPLQPNSERRWQYKMQYSGVQSYCSAMRRWNG